MSVATLTRRTTPPPVWHGHQLAAGDVCTIRHRFLGPISMSLRCWWHGKRGTYVWGCWMARPGRLIRVHADDILIVERDGRRLS